MSKEYHHWLNFLTDACLEFDSHTAGKNGLQDGLSQWVSDLSFAEMKSSKFVLQGVQWAVWSARHCQPFSHTPCTNSSQSAIWTSKTALQRTQTSLFFHLMSKESAGTIQRCSLNPWPTRPQELVNWTLCKYMSIASRTISIYVMVHIVARVIIAGDKIPWRTGDLPQHILENHKVACAVSCSPARVSKMLLPGIALNSILYCASLKINCTCTYLELRGRMLH